MFTKPFVKHLAPALLAGLALRLFFIWHFPFSSGDTAYYEELARNWLYHGVYGFYSHGQLLPSDARAPGYPAFLAEIYFLAGTGRKAVMLAQAFVDLATCVLAAGIAARLAAGAPGEIRSRVAAAALWLTALCPFTANYSAVPQTEVLATLFTTLALLIFLSPAGMALDRIASNRDLLRAVRNWLAGGLVVGLGTLVRPETPLLLGTVLIVLWLRYRRRTNWGILAVATLWLIVGLLLPLAPWAARNAVNLGRVQFLAPRYAETFGDVLPTGFYAWTKTWMFRFQDAYLFTWKLPSQPIDLKNLPSYAADSPEELSRVSSLLERYNRARGMTRSLDLEFAELARQRARRHPIRTYVWIPIERAAAIWFSPRIALLPYSGKLWPLSESHRSDPTGFAVTLGFALLNVLCVVMGLAAAWSLRTNPGILLIVAFILIRTAFLTQLQTCEPRYVSVCFPALLAMGAQLSHAPRIGWKRPPAVESYFTLTLTSIFPFAAICTLSPLAMYFCSTSGSAHSKSQPSSMAMSVYRPGTTKFSANVPSESAWSRRNSAGLLFKSSGARTIIAPGAGLSFLSAIPAIFAVPLAAVIVTFTSCAVAI
jgi:hypothetical protein